MNTDTIYTCSVLLYTLGRVGGVDVVSSMPAPVRSEVTRRSSCAVSRC